MILNLADIAQQYVIENYPLLGSNMKYGKESLTEEPNVKDKILELGLPLPLGVETMAGRIFVDMIDVPRKTTLLLRPETSNRVDPKDYPDHPYQGYIVAMNNVDKEKVSLLDKIYLLIPPGDSINVKGKLFMNVSLAHVAGIVYS